MPPVPTPPQEQDDAFVERKREELTKFYGSWVRHLDEVEEGSITPSVGGPRITKYKGEFYIDPQGRTWDNETPPADLTALALDDAIVAAVEADLAANAPVQTVEDVQNAFNFRALDFYELVEEEWYKQMQGDLHIGKDYADDADIDLRRFVSLLADTARENYLLVGGAGQLDGKGQEIPEGKIDLAEYARRVTLALRFLFYGGE